MSLVVPRADALRAGGVVPAVNQVRWSPPCNGWALSGTDVAALDAGAG
jgi:hypothetical protein